MLYHFLFLHYILIESVACISLLGHACFYIPVLGFHFLNPATHRGAATQI